MPVFRMYSMPSSDKCIAACVKRFCLVSAVSLMLLPAGCTTTGAAQRDERMASMENFLSREQLAQKAPSERAELIFAQLKLDRALSANDQSAILESANLLLSHTKGTDSQKSSASLVDAAIWLLAHDCDEEALALVSKASALLPEDLPLVALKADLLIQQNERDAAIALLKDFVKRHPKDEKAQAELALILLRSGRSDEAMASFRTIPEKKLTPQIRFAYAQSLNIAREFSEAEKQLRTAVEDDPEYSEAWQLLALTLEEQGRGSEAMAIYVRLLSADPANRSARLFLIRYHLRSQNLEAATSVVADAQEPLPFAVAAASMLMEEKQFGIAEKLLEMLNRIPNMPETLQFYHAAMLYESEGDLNRALQLLNRVPSDSEEYDKAMRMKVRILCELKRLPEALEAVETVHKLNPEDAEPLLLKAELLTRLKDFEAADKVLRKALASHPDNETANFQFAYLHELKGQREAAMSLMEEVILRFPDNAMALNYVGYNLADSGKELDRALELVQRASALDPDADFIADSLAWTLYRLGRMDEAWEHIQRAIALSRNGGNIDPTMLEHYGDIAKARNDKAETRRGYEEALAGFLKYNLKDDAKRVEAKLKAL